MRVMAPIPPAALDRQNKFKAKHVNPFDGWFFTGFRFPYPTFNV
jgi:hypothetical protein